MWWKSALVTPSTLLVTDLAHSVILVLLVDTVVAQLWDLAIQGNGTVIIPVIARAKIDVLYIHTKVFLNFDDTTPKVVYMAGLIKDGYLHLIPKKIINMFISLNKPSNYCRGYKTVIFILDKQIGWPLSSR